MTRQPAPRLAKALAALCRAEEQADLARADLHAAIVEQLAAGVRQAELVKTTGYSREHLRRIARDAGIPPA